MSRSTTIAGLSLAIALNTAALSPALAQASSPFPAPSKDPMAAPAGDYRIDKNHHSIVARIDHQGVSYSTIRFGASEALLHWDPANIEKSRVNVTVDMQPHFAPVIYHADPGGPNFLNISVFPKATFVSTAIKRTGADSGQIQGDLTFMGKTRPATIAAEFIGVGRSSASPTIGFTGTLTIKKSDFGFVGPKGSIRDTIDINIDVEFAQADKGAKVSSH